MPGGNIFHGDLTWPFAEDGAEAGARWGVATGHERVLLCGAGARARRRGQRHRRPQRGDGGARGRVIAETITRKLLLPRPHRR